MRGYSLKVCLGPSSSERCPTAALIPRGKSRCAACARVYERARGTRQQRGYDMAHDRMRAAYQRRMDAGERFVCWRCAELGKPHAVDPTSWDLGHDDRDRSKYRGPECVAGNRATAGRRATGVTVVCGPPCSGKTTWVRERALPGDLIVDYDDIARRLGSTREHDHHPRFHKPIEATIARAIAGVRAGRHERAWIIRSGVERARELATDLGGALVVLDEPDEVLHERALRRANPAATRRAIAEWRQANRPASGAL